MGKILEKIIYNRLLTCAEAGGALSDQQCGFRKGRSTIDAIRRVTTPPYLMEILSNYFQDRKGEQEYIVTAGVPQGSVFGPLLRDIMYN